jgi:hypothetical protein
MSEANLNKRQSYYDKLVQAAQDGTFPSVDGDGKCKYRGPDGKKCAIGIELTDEEAADEGEGMSFEDISCGVINRLELSTGLNRFDLAKVQGVHDNNASKYNPTTFKQVRKAWSLNKFTLELNQLECFADVKKVEL